MNDINEADGSSSSDSDISTCSRHDTRQGEFICKKIELQGSNGLVRTERICIKLESETEGSSSNDSETEDSSSSCSSDNCTSIKLPEHLAACLENRKLVRKVDTVSCNNDLKQKVMCNYVVAKKILSYLSWQDKVVCKLVCWTWHAAVRALKRKEIGSIGFVGQLSREELVLIKMSDNLYNEPMVVLTFACWSLNSHYGHCMTFTPCPCQPPCRKEHFFMDYLQKQFCGPKNCLFAVFASIPTFMPLNRHAAVSSSLVLVDSSSINDDESLCGVYIPVLSDVKFHVINIKMNNCWLYYRQRYLIDSFSKIGELAQTRIFKGALIYPIKEHPQLFMRPDEYIGLLNFIDNSIEELQPDVPYALGGSIIYDTIAGQGQRDIESILKKLRDSFDSYGSDHAISIGLFSVPKQATHTKESSEKCNFEMFSLVIEERSKEQIEQAINEFSKKIPHLEHSVAIKMSSDCRDHGVEMNCFTAAFPYTRIVGCNGSRQLGRNYPARQAAPAQCRANKRRKLDIVHDSSTVFVYIGWGKVVVKAAEPTGSQST